MASFFHLQIQQHQAKSFPCCLPSDSPSFASLSLIEDLCDYNWAPTNVIQDNLPKVSCLVILISSVVLILLCYSTLHIHRFWSLGHYRHLWGAIILPIQTFFIIRYGLGVLVGTYIP